MRASFARRGATVAIVAVTASVSAESRARAAQAGFDLYLTKPVDPVNLPAIVAGVLRDKR
jgi:DNA-binding response OmpR family regulator